jgi:crotonobetaine/carnitine-CoA ligase
MFNRFYCPAGKLFEGMLNRGIHNSPEVHHILSSFSAMERHDVLSLADRTIGKIVHHAAERFGERPFVQWREEVFSFAETNRRANRVANVFRSLGVGFGTRVAILCSNRIEYLDIWFGLAKLGAIQLPLNMAYKAPQISHTLSRAEVPIVVIQHNLAAEFERLVEQSQLAGCYHVVSLDGEVKGPPGVQCHKFSDLILAASDADPGDPGVSGSDIGAIMNTSGTTGLAKGVLVPHGQQYWLAKNMALMLELNSEDIYYNFFPLFHNTSQAMITLPVLLVGARMVLTEKFSLSQFWSDVRRYDVTVFYYIGEILNLLVKAGDTGQERDARLRAGWGIGGAPCDVANFECTHGVLLGTGYGSTEGNVPVFRPLGADPTSASTGRVLPEFTVRIADPQGRTLPAGEMGEILIRSDEPSALFVGYDGDPTATAEAMREGWFHSGDVGRFDEEGNLYFMSRLKDVIRVKGENVSAFEIENALMSFPGVLEAAAVAVPSELGGDEVKAVIVLAEGESVDYGDLLKHCARMLPKFALPRYIEFSVALPKTATNKIQKNVLREDSFNVRTWDSRAGSYLPGFVKNDKDGA